MYRLYWILALFLGGFVLLAGCAGRQRVAGTQERTTTGGAHQVTITLTGSGVDVDPKTIPPGDLNIRVVNKRNDPESVTINGPALKRTTDTIPPGQSTTLSVTNAQAGSYNITTVPPSGPSAAQTKLTVNPTQPSSQQPSRMTNVMVKVTNSNVSVSPQRVPPGPVTAMVNYNAGQPGTVTIQGPGGINQTTPQLQPGQNATLTFSNLQPASMPWM